MYLQTVSARNQRKLGEHHKQSVRDDYERASDQNTAADVRLNANVHHNSLVIDI